MRNPHLFCIFSFLKPNYGYSLWKKNPTQASTGSNDRCLFFALRLGLEEPKYFLISFICMLLYWLVFKLLTVSLLCKLCGAKTVASLYPDSQHGMSWVHQSAVFPYSHWRTRRHLALLSPNHVAHLNPVVNAGIRTCGTGDGKTLWEGRSCVEGAVGKVGAKQQKRRSCVQEGGRNRWPVPASWNDDLSPRFLQRKIFFGKLRTRTFIFVPRLAVIGVINSEFSYICLFCGEQVKEDALHPLLKLYRLANCMECSV